MSVNPVSVNPFGGAVLSRDALAWNAVKERLKKLGYKSTGSANGDNVLLENVLRAKAMPTPIASETKLPWQDILDKLVVSSTRNRDKDYTLIMKTLDEKIQTPSKSEKAYYENLKQQADNIFSIDAKTQATPMASMVGMDLLAQLNKKFMI